MVGLKKVMMGILIESVCICLVLFGDLAYSVYGRPKTLHIGGRVAVGVQGASYGGIFPGRSRSVPLLPCQGNIERVAEAFHLLNIAAYCVEGHSGVYDTVH